MQSLREKGRINDRELRLIACGYVRQMKGLSAATLRFVEMTEQLADNNDVRAIRNLLTLAERSPDDIDKAAVGAMLKTNAYDAYCAVAKLEFILADAYTVFQCVVGGQALEAGSKVCSTCNNDGVVFLPQDGFKFNIRCNVCSAPPSYLLTPDVRKLMEQCNRGDWTATLPLSDALEEAGIRDGVRCATCRGRKRHNGWRCDECQGVGYLPGTNSALDHLRNHPFHVKGCWVVDALRGITR